jgi:hypothetical protein
MDVSMPSALAHYRLPAAWTAEELTAAMRASLQILDLAPDRVTVPLLGATYRAVFGSADFSLHLAGRTGSGKSELAALAQQHFGPEMTARCLPGAWFSTANQLEGLAFAAKDAVFVIDEFVPEGTAADRARLQQAASRLLRGAGNGAGRGRAGKDGLPRAARPPRALLISTGEEIPAGQSLRARTLVIEVSRTSIGGGDLRALKPHQQAAVSGLYATAMAGFIHWLAAGFEVRREAFAAQVHAHRETLGAIAGHGRTASIGAQLAAIWRFIAEFAVACGTTDANEAAAIMRRADAALAMIGEEQAAIQAASDPVERFRELLNGAVASGRAHIASSDDRAPATPAAMGWRKAGMDWLPQGHCIGWEDGAGGLFLEPEAALAAVRAMGEAADDRIGVSGIMLRKALHERGLLLGVETADGKTHLAVRRTIGGRRRRVLHVPNLLSLPDEGE